MKIIEVVFYRGAGGAEPVREWLLRLTRADRRTVGEDLKTVEFGWPLGMPLVDSFSGYKGLWRFAVSSPAAGSHG